MYTKTGATGWNFTTKSLLPNDKKKEYEVSVIRTPHINKLLQLQRRDIRGGTNMVTFFKHLLKNIEEYLGLFFLTIMCVFMFLQLFSRFFLTEPLIFTEEVTRYSYLWIVFVGISLALKHRAHIRIDFFLELLPASSVKYIRIVIRLISMGIFFYVIYWGIRFVIFTRVIVSPALEISLMCVSTVIPLGYILAFIRTAQELWRELRFENEEGRNVGV